MAGWALGQAGLKTTTRKGLAALILGACGGSADDGKDTFCVPMASVIHGFIYNKDAFDELGLVEPQLLGPGHGVDRCA